MIEDKELREDMITILKRPRTFAGTASYEEWIAEQLETLYKEAGYRKISGEPPLLSEEEVQDIWDAEMTEPTREEIKEFWEWYGFRHFLETKYNRSVDMWEYPKPSGVKRNRSYLPPIDLNNLFRYAVPNDAEVRLRKAKNMREKHCHVILDKHPWEVDAFGKTNALALFRALQSMIKAEGNDSNLLRPTDSNQTTFQ